MIAGDMLVSWPMHRRGTARSIDQRKQGKAFAGTPPMVRKDERRSENGVGATLRVGTKLTWKRQSGRIDLGV